MLDCKKECLHQHDKDREMTGGGLVVPLLAQKTSNRAVMMKRVT